MLKSLVASAISMSLVVPVLAADVTYRKDIRPLWEQKCAACHGAGSPYLGDFETDQKKYAAQMKGPRMDTYADLISFVGWPDTGAVMRRLDDGKGAKGGKPGNMYQYLGGTDAERQKNLKLFKAWVGEGAWTLKRFKARGNVPGITKEELERIKVEY
ncbi:MAG: cytochrome C [Betaproteobacteria bacterium]|nr:cytochrome C [Betaproteobacteria bacterium]